MGEGSPDKSEDRTDLAEDRTLLANERTFSGWVRTSMAAIGVGVGFHVLFQKVEPGWVAKGIASVFILLGIILVVIAERRAFEVKHRLRSHSVEPLKSLNLKLVMYGVSLGGVSLIAAIWWLV
ncbi:MAG TPA: DUF202 domain-containing protein [Sphingomonadaceae bacterium]|nr:DUF202 domain-containing protein [Sphingomonadaceae bacterium]